MKLICKKQSLLLGKDIVGFRYSFIPYQETKELVSFDMAEDSYLQEAYESSVKSKSIPIQLGDALRGKIVNGEFRTPNENSVEVPNIEGIQDSFELLNKKITAYFNLKDRFSDCVKVLLKVLEEEGFLERDENSDRIIPEEYAFMCRQLGGSLLWVDDSFSKRARVVLDKAIARFNYNKNSIRCSWTDLDDCYIRFTFYVS